MPSLDRTAAQSAAVVIIQATVAFPRLFSRTFPLAALADPREQHFPIAGGTNLCLRGILSFPLYVYLSRRVVDHEGRIGP